MSFEPVYGADAGDRRAAPESIFEPAFFQKLDDVVRRSLEIVLALILILFLCPLMLCVALMIRATGPGVIYAHRRVGRFGRPFPCYKFRTMVVDGDTRLAAYLADNPAAAHEWQTTRKLKHDPRVTRFGLLLRQTSVDELPQLFNVLFGSMSFVGPRPIVYDEVRFYGATLRDYLRVRPGLTGLWQVSGRSSLTYADRVAFDRQYLRNRSLLLDLNILVRTVPAVMRRTETF